MGFFDGSAALAFLHDAQGRTLIRPFGKLGKTYLVPDGQQARFVRFFKRSGIALFVLVVTGMSLFPYAYGILIVSGVLAAFYLSLYLLVRGLETVDAQPVETRRDLHARHARAMGRPWLIAGLTLCLLMVAASIALLVPGQLGAAAVSVGFFGLAAAMITRQLRLIGD